MSAQTSFLMDSPLARVNTRYCHPACLVAVDGDGRKKCAYKKQAKKQALRGGIQT